MPNARSLMFTFRRYSGTALLLLAAVAVGLVLAPRTARAEQRLERDGVVLFWGLVPSAIVSAEHSLVTMHGVVPADGTGLSLLRSDYQSGLDRPIVWRHD